MSRVEIYDAKLTYKSYIKEIYLNDVKSFIWTMLVFIHKSKYRTIEDDKKNNNNCLYNSTQREAIEFLYISYHRQMQSCSL
jgi:hypothetical protein